MKTNILLFALLTPLWLFAQQVADTAYQPPIAHPEYMPGKGPVVFIDEDHNNFHTKTGRYLPFARLLERDGYQVKAYASGFMPDKLSQGKILVISNALNEKNVDDWFLPTPSAFTKEEMDVVHNWVKNGGSLFLIADHMPMAGCAQELAARFGFEFINGFAFDTLGTGPASIFSLKDRNLSESILTKGRKEKESIQTVATFTGQGFRIPADATPVLTLSKSFISLEPDTAWVFTEKTKKYNAGGLSQGAFKKVGKGRIVVFGEAAMFTAQLAGPQQMKAGMNSDDAPQNYLLLLNIIHWLDGKLD